MELLRWAGRLAPADSKTYRRLPFAVPPGARALRIHLSYERGGDLPHNLVTLSLFDPAGFRGAGHRFAPRQRIDVTEAQATPGFLPGALPAGDWELEVDVHCVLAPSAVEVRVETSEAAPAGEAEARRAQPPAAPTGPRRWLRGELHLHSTHSDGRWTTGEMAAAARGRGLDFMFLTDHNTVSGIDSLRRAVDGGIAVHAGQELTTYRGHALALGPERWIDWRAGLDARGINDVARDVRAAGGVLVVAHPDAPPDPFCTGCQWTHADFDPALAHAVEVWGGLWDGPEERNAGCLALFHRWLDAGHRLAATGATDAHRHEDWLGAVPLTYVHAEDASLESVLEALRAGRTYVSSGPAIGIEARRGDGPPTTMGGTAEDADVVEASCAGSPGGELRLVAHGETRARAPVEGEARLRISPRPTDRWFNAELWRGEILLAVASPVYL
jgi:hypothetical protein